MIFFKIFDVFLLPKKHHQNYWKFLQVNNICLKADTFILQYTFYQFQYFITTYLHRQNLSIKFSVKTFSRKWHDGYINWGWSRLINKLSLLKSLNLFVLEARISKWSKSIEQLYSRRCSDTADCLVHLRHFPVKLEIPMCSSHFC